MRRARRLLAFGLLFAPACGGLIDDEDFNADSVRVEEPSPPYAADAGSKDTRPNVDAHVNADVNVNVGVDVALSADVYVAADAEVADTHVEVDAGTDTGVDATADVDVDVDATPDAGCPYTYVVDAVHGDDSNAGTCASPFKRLTKAVGLATTGQSIGVMPGTYDEVNGEVFPLKIAEGVSVIGDEAHKGTAPGAAVAITGTIAVEGGALSTLLDPGMGSTIAGLRIQCKDCGFFGNAIQITQSQVTLRNNTITDNTRIGVYVVAGSTNHVIVGNVIARSFLGLGFIGGGSGSRVEYNVLRENKYGVEYDSPGGDLGGGASGSVGKNVFSCNWSTDLWTVSPVTITASNNFWDHVPPTRLNTLHGTDTDIYAPGAVVTVGSPELAANACP